MNTDHAQANWLQFKGKVKEQWGKLTDDDLDVIAGKRDQLLGKIQERHARPDVEPDQSAGRHSRFISHQYRRPHCAIGSI